jgi:hypothetical protein
MELDEMFRVLWQKATIARRFSPSARLPSDFTRTEEATMSRVKQASKQKHTTKAATVKVLGAAGLSFSLVGSASASTMPTTGIPQSDNTSPNQRQGEARVSCAGPGPDNTCIVRRTVGVEPKIAGSPRVIGVRKSQCPKSYVMPFPRTVIDGLLKADVLAAPKEIEGAEGSGRVRRIENERASHVPRAFKAQPICFRPAKGRKGRLKLLESAYERNIDRIAREPIARDCEAGHKLAL